jgi:hypothetical protein
VSLFAPLPVGAEIAAAREFGEIAEGQIGIITGFAQRPHGLRWRGQYLCTFLGAMHAVACRGDICERAHGCTRETLEDPLWFMHRNTPAGPYSNKRDSNGRAWDVLRGLDKRRLKPPVDTRPVTAKPDPLQH